MRRSSFKAASKGHMARALTATMVLLAISHSVGAKNVVAEDSSGITLAVMQANTAALTRIGKTEGPARLAARAGYYRVHGNIAESNTWADKCTQDEAVRAEKSQGVMYLCRSLRAGNRLLQGDIAGWARDMVEVRRIYEEKVAPSLGAGEEVAAVTRPQFEKFLTTPESGRRQGSRVPGTRIPVKEDVGVPVVRGKIRDGHDGKRRNIDSDFILDTGSSWSHLSRKAALAMGATVTEGFGVDLTDPARPVSIGLVTPVDVELGGMTFRNVSFTVTDSIDYNIIGLDLIEQMGPIALKPGHLEILTSIAPSTCKYPVATTSALWGGQRSVRLPMKIGKRNELVLMDTGADLSLEVSGINLATYPKEGIVEKKRFTMHGLVPVRYAEATAPVEFNGVTATFQTLVSDQPAMVFPISWRAGYGLRDTYDYYLDVAGGRGCLSPRS